MPFEKMQRVSRKSPCPVCSKPDWCLVAEDGSAAICARISDGSVKKCGDAGWLHIFKHDGYRSRTFSRRIPIHSGDAEAKDFAQLANRYQR